MLFPPCGLLVPSTAPYVLIQTHDTHLSPQYPASSWPDGWGMPHDHRLTTPPLPQLPVTDWPEAPRSQGPPRRGPLPNLENRVGVVALNQAAGEPLPFPSRAWPSGGCGGWGCGPATAFLSSRCSVECYIQFFTLLLKSLWLLLTLACQRNKSCPCSCGPP